jgi:hypothetical protein
MIEALIRRLGWGPGTATGQDQDQPNRAADVPVPQPRAATAAGEADASQAGSAGAPDAWQARQGDIWLVRVDERLPAGVIRVPREGGRVVLARGEATGHEHAVADPDAVLYATPGATGEVVDRWLRVGGAGATLVHAEHRAIALPPGLYRVRRQREYRPRVARLVAD